MSDLARRQLPDTGWSGQVEQAYTPAGFEELCMMAARYDLRVHIVGGGRSISRVNQTNTLYLRDGEMKQNGRKVVALAGKDLLWHGFRPPCELR